MTESELNKRFWNNVDGYLKSQNKDLKQLAKDTGLDYENLRNRMHNNQTIRKSSECIIADYLNVDYALLVTEQGIKDFKITDTTISIRVNKPLSERNISRLQGYVDRMIEENGTED